MGPRIYIAGAITNDPNYRRRFAHWSTQFRAAGWEVVSPSELTQAIHRDDWERAAAADVDIPLLLTCTAIHMIEGWERSRAARAEWAIAEWKELTILYSNSDALDCTDKDCCA